MASRGEIKEASQRIKEIRNVAKKYNVGYLNLENLKTPLKVNMKMNWILLELEWPWRN